VSEGVYVKNVGVNAFSLVAAVFWLYGFQPDEEMQVSGLADEGQLNLRGHAEVPGGVNAITLRDRYPWWRRALSRRSARVIAPCRSPAMSCRSGRSVRGRTRVSRRSDCPEVRGCIDPLGSA
jgi:hypothetical protein